MIPLYLYFLMKTDSFFLLVLVLILAIVYSAEDLCAMIGMNFVPGMTYGAEDAIETSNDVVERKGKGNFLFLFLKIVFSSVLFLAGLLIDAEADVENEVFGVDLAIGEEVDTVSEVPEVLNEIEVVAGPSNESREPAVAKKPRKTRNAQGIDLDVTLVGRERVLRPVNRHPVKGKLTF